MSQTFLALRTTDTFVSDVICALETVEIAAPLTIKPDFFTHLHKGSALGLSIHEPPCRQVSSLHIKASKENKMKKKNSLLQTSCYSSFPRLLGRGAAFDGVLLVLLRTILHTATDGSEGGGHWGLSETGKPAKIYIKTENRNKIRSKPKNRFFFLKWS